jgi:hypothetical protein
MELAVDAAHYILFELAYARSCSPARRAFLLAATSWRSFHLLAKEFPNARNVEKALAAQLPTPPKRHASD